MRRINIRATEIETFQRTHVIMPNSMFLQNPVVNRTYADTSSRVEIKLTVGWRPTSRKIEALLREAALGHPRVLRVPAPIVRFDRIDADRPRLRAVRVREPPGGSPGRHQRSQPGDPGKADRERDPRSRAAFPTFKLRDIDACARRSRPTPADAKPREQGRQIAAAAPQRRRGDAPRRRWPLDLLFAAGRAGGRGAVGLFARACRPRLLIARYANDRSKFIDVGGVRAHVRDQGNPDGIPLVLIHGSSGSLHEWEGWARELGAQARLISVDLPGHGLTGAWPRDEYTVEAYADFIEVLVDALNLDRFVLAGHSLGGAVAWTFAATRPDRVSQLILVDSAGYPRDDGETPLADAARPPAGAGRHRHLLQARERWCGARSPTPMPIRRWRRPSGSGAPPSCSAFPATARPPCSAPAPRSRSIRRRSSGSTCRP